MLRRAPSTLRSVATTTQRHARTGRTWVHRVAALQAGGPAPSQSRSSGALVTRDRGYTHPGGYRPVRAARAIALPAFVIRVGGYGRTSQSVRTPSTGSARRSGL